MARYFWIILFGVLQCYPALADSILRENLTVGGDKKINIPVPAGNWLKVSEKVDYRFDTPFIHYSFLNIIDGKVHSFLYAKITKNSSQRGWKYSKLCNRKNLHFIKKISNRNGGKIDCYLVNHWRVTGGEGGNTAPQKVQRETWDYIEKKNIKSSSTFIVAGLMMAEKHLLEVRLGYNPEMFGFPPVRDANWSSNDWHQNMIIGEFEKQSFIRALEEVAFELHEKVEEQFF